MPGSSNYQIIQEISTTPLLSAGPHTYTVNPTVEKVMVSKGYIIGYISTTGLIATRGLWPNETSDLEGPSGPVCTPPCTPTGSFTSIGARHLLRATASKPASVLFFHTFKNTERLVQFKVSDDRL